MTFTVHVSLDAAFLLGVVWSKQATEQRIPGSLRETLPQLLIQIQI